MYTYYGIWIDHAKAFILKGNKLGEFSVEFMGSDVEPHTHGSEGGEHLTIASEERQNERRHNQMKAFTREILKKLSDANEILVFGPGTAKHEFKNELEEHKPLASKLKGVESADHMTEAELKEFAKHYFKLPQA